MSGRRIAPRFDLLRPATPKAADAKRRNKARGTEAELALRRRLWSLGLRYRPHAASIMSADLGVLGLCLVEARLLLSRRLELVFVLPLTVGHAVDGLARLFVIDALPARIRLCHPPFGEAVALEAGQVHGAISERSLPPRCVRSAPVGR